MLSPHAESELRVLFGVTDGEWLAEPLAHNTSNTVTAGIWRVRAGARRIVLKEIRHRDSDNSQWAPSNQPEHWNYWCREAFVYRSGLCTAFESDGIRAPRLLGYIERDRRSIALWLEDLSGLPAERWGVAGLAEFARRLGAAQGRRVGAVPSLPWLSRGFVRSYIDSKNVDYGLLAEDAAWDQPLIRDNCPVTTRTAALMMYRHRETLLKFMDGLPRTLCHLDVWPKNMVEDEVGEMAMIDWSFVGEGALGEDLGNLIPDCIFDMLYPSTLLPTLDRELFSAYMRGLRSVGWTGDERLVRLGVCASAVKYVWLAPLLLERARLEKHRVYGGGAAVSAPRLYAERGATIAYLGGWAEEALRLADRVWA